MSLPADSQPGGSQPPDPQLLKPVDEAARRVLAAVLAALDRGSGPDAVRAFLDGIARGALPKDVNLARWLVDVVGDSYTLRLIKALAFQPCFYCSQGRAECDACGGRGRGTTGEICGSCLGLGQAFCDFCNGSGWVTVSLIPDDLRHGVVIARLHWVEAALRELPEKPAEVESRDDPVRAGKACAHLLADLNRVMGALENAVIAAGGAIPRGQADEKTVARILDSCARTAPKVDRRMREVLQEIARIARERASHATDEARRKSARERAEFYELILDHSMTRTTLEHPFLRRFLATGEVPRPPARPPEAPEDAPGTGPG